MQKAIEQMAFCIWVMLYKKLFLIDYLPEYSLNIRLTSLAVISIDICNFT
jgi:hypothetical protein